MLARFGVLCLVHEVCSISGFVEADAGGCAQAHYIESRIARLLHGIGVAR